MRERTRGTSRWIAQACVLLVVCALPPRALAHGGAYNPGAPGVPTGPWSPSGPGPSTGMPSPAGIPGASTNAMGNRASWEDWWHFNKDPFLELKLAVSSGLPVTAADELLAGPSRRAAIDPELLRSRVAPALPALLANERSPKIVTPSLVP